MSRDTTHSVDGHGRRQGRKRQTKDAMEHKHKVDDKADFYAMCAYGTEQTEIEVQDRQLQTIRYAVSSTL